jgi:metallo-beta-lactamase class B
VKSWGIGLLFTAALAGLCGTMAMGQARADTVEAHVAAAKAAARDEHVGLFNALCLDQIPQAAKEWHTEPVKVFDNLYFVGQLGYSAWAITTSSGIILVDTIYDYSVEDEVVGGLKKLGLDPATIKYAIVSHAHGDHAGGARYLQDHFGTHVVLAAADWDLLDRSTSSWPRPVRDMVATDGQKLTLGDTTVTIFLTPGHTPGSISVIFPVKDGRQTHVAAEWGGTGYNFTVSPDKPRRFWFETYLKSVEHFRDAARKAGADAVVANHWHFDGSATRLPAMAKRKAGDPHPWVIGADSVQRYLTVTEECAKAGLGRLQ